MVALLTACSTVQVSQDYVKNYNFATATTFNWNEKLQHENDDRYQHDELLSKRFRKAIEDTFAQKRFKQDLQPELLVSYSYQILNRLQVDDYNSHFGFGYGRYGRYSGVGLGTGNVIEQYDQGKLVINVHSAKTGELLWKGTGTQEVFTHSSPEQITGRVNEMVEAVLAQYPPSRL
jgi:hypothetical protein